MLDEIKVSRAELLCDLPNVPSERPAWRWRVRFGAYRVKMPWVDSLPSQKRFHPNVECFKKSVARWWWRAVHRRAVERMPFVCVEAPVQGGSHMRPEGNEHALPGIDFKAHATGDFDRSLPVAFAQTRKIWCA